ncbi:MAG: hypothetical protein ABI763_09585, partial [Bacteroidota bacterium]
ENGERSADEEVCQRIRTNANRGGNTRPKIYKGMKMMKHIMALVVLPFGEGVTQYVNADRLMGGAVKYSPSPASQPDSPSIL